MPRDLLTMTYKGYTNKKVITGHWNMFYHVTDVLDSNGSLLLERYTFKSKIFKGLGLKEGDKVTGTFEIISDNGTLKLLRPKDIKKL